MSSPEQPMVQQARNTLITTTELSLAEAMRRGLVSFPEGHTAREAAEVVVDHLTAMTLLQVLSSLANFRPDREGGS